MTTISSNRKLVTLINVFTVEPANQERLLDLLVRATETSVRHAPGFISASPHGGFDGTKVTMYAKWSSVEDYEAMRRNPAHVCGNKSGWLLKSLHATTISAGERVDPSQCMPTASPQFLPHGAHRKFL
jgi:quinol monooxygenase YgiN